MRVRVRDLVRVHVRVGVRVCVCDMLLHIKLYFSLSSFMK